ncbi:MAG: hypothetical protein A3J55_01455 [Candidatus Ryanbacteria bacterium RIFCSPHIGHO2_02_FULL_45_17b]|uniref:Uncharacterized protein n=1 Tax=Candidatus Ryanbacteria bacterium RIFCSPHIGHO2_01_FULL_45_22 TaxID=1802114 RepID=A0A1G2G158_9BACT|nr:MAG: hypothetical protein A2719_00270 [Candidatus Ryanbacteria bacterium RIFCSPHIGHO2_01_FULL_45_22]OGZ47434.1 MAG: hypothetical protein A3J55_01455 [Candidatus Ryanbacteria bacterium RIFCSPHIGHO2_02_FULL_45_17b]
MNLQETAKLIDEIWQFDESNYPARLKNVSPEEARAFAFDHLQKHLSKNVGSLAGIVESVDHGLPLDTTDILRIVRNLFVGSLHLASVAGISTEALCDEVGRWALERERSNISPLQIDTSFGFASTFGQTEREILATHLVEFAQTRGHWGAFRRSDIRAFLQDDDFYLDEAELNDFVKNNNNGTYSFTGYFIRKCHEAYPCAIAETISRMRGF